MQKRAKNAYIVIIGHKQDMNMPDGGGTRGKNGDRFMGAWRNLNN